MANSRPFNMNPEFHGGINSRGITVTLDGSKPSTFFYHAGTETKPKAKPRSLRAGTLINAAKYLLASAFIPGVNAIDDSAIAGATAGSIMGLICLGMCCVFCGGGDSERNTVYVPPKKINANDIALTSVAVQPVASTVAPK